MKSRKKTDVMRGFNIRVFSFFFGLLIAGLYLSAGAQIYEPEGLNMPGTWNTWTNPPTNNLALASSTQVTGGRVEKITDGAPRWQTILKVAATGGDLTAGTYTWLFTSGPLTNAFQNKWAAVTVIMDSLQLYTKEGATDNSVTLENGFYYTVNWEDIGYVNSRAIFMKTSQEPVEITGVTFPEPVASNSPETITMTLSGQVSSAEHIFTRYSVDNWVTSAAVPATVTGSTATAQIPGQPAGTTVSFYAFSSTKASVTADYDLYTIHYKINDTTNYSYTVVGTVPDISYASLDHPGSGSIQPSQPFEIFGNCGIPFITGYPTPAAGLEAWIGWNAQNTNPATWSNWAPASYFQPSSTYDQFKGNLGALITTQGRWYYAFRYKYYSGGYVYGGFGTTTNGFWNGTTSVSGVLDVSVGLGEMAFPGLKIYPNPASDLVNIELREPATIRLSNILGSTILIREISAGIQQINIASLKPGIYHLEISAGARMVHRSFVKQ
jgi:hypothetical protein